MSGFQAVVLAAGRGSRLGELGTRVPKALVEVGNRPLLARQLDFLAREGAEHVVVTAFHLSEQIVEYVEHASHGIPVDVSVEPELLGTAGGVRHALPHLDPAEPIVVLHADTLVDEPIADIVAAHRASGAVGTICAEHLGDTTGKGVIGVDGNGLIFGFREKPVPPVPGLANAGLYVLERELAELPGFDFGHDVFPLAVGRGLRLRVHRLDGFAYDIGTPEALAGAGELVA